MRDWKLYKLLASRPLKVSSIKKLYNYVVTLITSLTFDIKYCLQVVHLYSLPCYNKATIKTLVVTKALLVIFSR